MNIWSRLNARLRKELFLPSPLGIVINPFHITRSALSCNLRELVPMLTGDVLDFGCGSKPYASLFASARSYAGVDIEISGHDHSTSEVDFFYDGETLPFDDGRYDAVASFETLEHIFNPSRILSEINRVTKGGGMLLLSVPFVWDEHEVPYDCARYTSFGLRHVLGAAGYDIVELRKTTTYFLTVAQMLIAYLHQHVFPRRGFFRHLCQVMVIFPVSALAYALNSLLPKRYDLFCDCIVLARKSRPALAVVL
jgi:SAM-dependent methyltransferase